MDTVKEVLTFCLQFGFGIGAWYAVWGSTEWLSKRWSMPKWKVYAGRTILFVTLALLALLLPDGGRTPLAAVMIGAMALIMALETVGSYRRQKAIERYERYSRF